MANPLWGVWAGIKDRLFEAALQVNGQYSLTCESALPYISCSHSPVILFHSTILLGSYLRGREEAFKNAQGSECSIHGEEAIKTPMFHGNTG